MQIQEIETYLQALDEELAQQKIRKPVRLVVVGGVYMMLVLGNRSSTKDVDIIPLDFPDTTNPNKETKAFRSAINAVAKRFGIRRDWMNDVVSAFIPDLGPVTVWREYQHLHVYVPSQEYILVLKLLAGREKDEEDILALCEVLNIQTREQAQTLVDRYATPEWQKECSLRLTLNDLFG